MCDVCSARTQCRDIVSGACQEAATLLGESQELAILCAICAELRARQLIGTRSLETIGQYDGFCFVLAGKYLSPLTYRCGVVPAVLYDLAVKSQQQQRQHQQQQQQQEQPNQAMVAALLSKMLDAARHSDESPGRLESFLHAQFTLAWGQRSRDTLSSAFPCLKTNTPLRPMEQHCTIDYGTPGSALQFQRDKLAIFDSTQSKEIDVAAAPTSIHFCGSNQPAGFDIMMFQPRTSDSAAVLVVIETKYSQPSGMKFKIERCVAELAPFLPGMCGGVNLLLLLSSPLSSLVQGHRYQERCLIFHSLANMLDSINSNTRYGWAVWQVCHSQWCAIRAEDRSREEVLGNEKDDDEEEEGGGRRRTASNGRVGVVRRACYHAHSGNFQQATRCRAREHLSLVCFASTICRRNQGESDAQHGKGKRFALKRVDELDWSNVALVSLVSQSTCQLEADRRT